MKVKKGIEYVIAYLFWAVTIGLGAWLVITSRNTLELFLSKYYIKDINQWLLTKQAIFIDIAIPVLLWLLWFVMLIVVEEYYRKGVEKRNLVKRFMKVTGVLVILIFLDDLLFNLMLGFATTIWLRWLLAIIELLVGAILLIASRSKPAAQTNEATVR